MKRSMEDELSRFEAELSGLGAETPVKKQALQPPQKPVMPPIPPTPPSMPPPIATATTTATPIRPPVTMTTATPIRPPVAMTTPTMTPTPPNLPIPPPMGMQPHMSHMTMPMGFMPPGAPGQPPMAMGGMPWGMMPGPNTYGFMMPGMPLPMGMPAMPVQVPGVQVVSLPTLSGAKQAGEEEKEEGKEGAKKGKRTKTDPKLLRAAAGKVWADTTLSEWDSNDFRIFVGDLGNDTTDDMLGRAFSQYPSFQKAKIVRDKRSNKSKGYGFVSFKDTKDYVRAMKEMNGKYCGNRPMKLRKSTWQERSFLTKK